MMVGTNSQIEAENVKKRPAELPLVIDAADVAREELAQVLEPYVRLTREGELVLQPDFEHLAARERLIAALLAFRAGQLLELRSAPGASPQDIERLTGMAGGTVRPTLSQLLRQRIVAREQGQYLIPAHSVRRAAGVLRDRARRAA